MPAMNLPYSHVALVVFALVGLLTGADTMAQVPHPFAVPEQTLTVGSQGWFSEWTGQIAIWQSEFYRQLTGAVRAWKADGFDAGWLLLLSFLYGVFHALGPGHGKAILSAYVLANRETIRNGAILAFASSLVQALVAILLVGVAAGILNVTGMVLNKVTAWLELGAYGLLTALGAWLIFKHIIKPVLRLVTRAKKQPAHDPHHDHAHALEHTHSHQHDSECGCGHSHLPAPERASGQLNWSKAWGAIVSIGLRPCSGAILVLVFALSQDFFIAGVASALAMGLGTGLTVAGLAIASLGFGRLAEKSAGGDSSRLGSAIGFSLQAMASLAVFAFGILLFAAAWQYNLGY